MSGLSLITTGRNNKTIVVSAVRKDSPALESGILKGDVLVDIDGEPSEKFTLSQIDDMFQQDGREYSLTFQRGKRIIKTTIKLRRLL